MKSRIIQIVHVPESEVTYEGLYVLCEDGTIWVAKTNVPVEKTEWEQVSTKIKGEITNAIK